MSNDTPFKTTVKVTAHKNPHELDDGTSILDSRCPVAEAHVWLERNDIPYDGLRPILVMRVDMNRLECHWGIELDDTLSQWLYIDRNDRCHLAKVDLSIITLDGGAPLNAPANAVQSAAPVSAA